MMPLGVMMMLFIIVEENIPITLFIEKKCFIKKVISFLTDILRKIKK